MKKLLLTTMLMAAATTAMMAETVTFDFTSADPYNWNSLPKDKEGYIDDSAKPLVLKEGVVSMTLDGARFRLLVQKVLNGQTCLLTYPKNDKNATATTVTFAVPQGYKMTEIVFYSAKGKFDGMYVSEGDIDFGEAEDTGEIYYHSENGSALAQITRTGYCNTAGPIQFTASGGTQVIEHVDVTFEATTLKEAKLAWSEREFVAYMNSDNKFPTLSKATDAAIDYQSDNEEVATINPTTGAITLVAPGVAKIIAGCDATSTYDWGEASYTLIVREQGEKHSVFSFGNYDAYKGIIHIPADDEGVVVWTGLLPDDAKAVYAGTDGVNLEDNGAKIHFYAGPEKGIDKYTCRMRITSTSSNINLQITGGTAFDVTAGGNDLKSVTVHFNGTKIEDVKAGNFVALNGNFPYEDCDGSVTWTPTDDKTKAIFQAAVGAYITEIEVAYHDPAAVKDAIAVPADTDAPVEYFDLQGRRVTNPAAGLYIRRQGSAVSKVIVK